MLNDDPVVGAASPTSFHNLGNHFPNITLSEHRPTLPMTLVWLFCSLAQRLGVKASPVGFPSTVLACISGWAEPRDDDPTCQPFYYDLYRNLQHSREGLAEQLEAHEVPIALHAELLDTARPRDIVLRSARNIYNSIGIHAAGGQGDNGIIDEVRLYASAYAASATLLCLSPLEPGSDSVEVLISIVRQRFPYDAAPLTRELGILGKHSAARMMQTLARSKALQESKPRTVKKPPAQVKHRVGQCFTHVKYEYKGLIVSWDERGSIVALWVANAVANDALNRL